MLQIIQLLKIVKNVTKHRNAKSCSYTSMDRDHAVEITGLDHTFQSSSLSLIESGTLL